MANDESAPIRTVTPEQIAAAQAAAGALDLAAIEARIRRDEATGTTRAAADVVTAEEAIEDRGWLFAEVQRLRGILREAPHVETCAAWGDDAGPCDCWKASAFRAAP